MPFYSGLTLTDFCVVSSDLRLYKQEAYRIEVSGCSEIYFYIYIYKFGYIYIYGGFPPIYIGQGSSVFIITCNIMQ